MVKFESTSETLASVYAEYAQCLARADLKSFADFYVSLSATLSAKVSSLEGVGDETKGLGLRGRGSLI